MKKLLFLILSLILAGPLTQAQTISYSMVPNGQCNNGSGTYTMNAGIFIQVPGANNYTWTIAAPGGTCTPTFSLGQHGALNAGNTGSQIAVTFSCCGVYTLTVFAFNTTVTPGIPILVTSGSGQATLSCQPTPTLSLTSISNFSPCITGSTLTASGANNYTWNPGALTGSQIVVNSTANTCYSVVGTSTSGCSASAGTCIAIAGLPTVQITSTSGTLCAGGSATLSGLGAMTYTWFTGSGVINGANIVVSPTVSTCYTLTGYNGTCAAATSTCVVLVPSPVVTIAGTNSICAGSIIMLTASGANTYAWSNSSVGSTMIVTPFTSTCYSVIGTNAFGCSSFAVHCVSVQNTFINITASSPSVCLGTSVTFTATGANTYTWNTGAFSPTLNVIPTSTGTYSAVGQGLNFCWGTASIVISVNAGCSDVWPGDANSDGIVNTSDVLELGLQFSNTGASRSPGGNTYVAQYAANWTGTVSTGKNKCHADCNGDGVVNNADTIAIVANFGLPHSFKPGAPGSTADISLVADQGVVFPGQWNKINVILGSSSNNISQLYGLTFDLNIDQTFLESNTAYFVYTPSFLNAANQNIEFRRAQLSSDKILAASVRVDQNNVSGYGKIAELWVKVKADAPNSSTINVSASNGNKINNLGVISPLTVGNDVLMVSTNLVGLSEAQKFENSMRFFPNPAKDKLFLYSESTAQVNYTINDLLGRTLASSAFTKSGSVDLSEFANGTYVLKFESVSGVAFKKMVVQK